MTINEFIVIIAMTDFALAPPVYESRLAHFVHYWNIPKNTLTQFRYIACLVYAHCVRVEEYCKCVLQLNYCRFQANIYRDFGVFFAVFYQNLCTYGIDIVTITAIKNSVNKDMCILHDNARTSCPSFRPRFCRLQEFCRTW